MRVVETFASLQGEGPFTGTYSFFVRLAGCNLRCPFCDTKYALDPRAGRLVNVCEIVHEALDINPNLVVVTGGEPLLQRRALEELAALLSAQGLKLQVETNGTLPAPDPQREAHLYSGAFFVVSPKDVPVKVPGARLHESWIVMAKTRPDRVWFKFLASSKDDIVEIVNYVESRGIPRSNVYVMPLTKKLNDLNSIIEEHRLIAQLAVKYRLNFSPRLHLIVMLP